MVTAAIIGGWSQFDDFLALPAADRAQWIGALGTIVAVAVAGAAAAGSAIHAARLAREQNAAQAALSRSNREAAEQAERSQFEARRQDDRLAALALVNLTVLRLEVMNTSLLAGGSQAEMAIRTGPLGLTSMRQALANFPFWKIADQVGIQQYAHVVGFLEFAIQAIGNLAVTIGPGDPSLHAKYREACEAAASDMRIIRDAVERCGEVMINVLDLPRIEQPSMEIAAGRPA